MKLISEMSENIECLVEAAKDGSKNHYIQGTFMQADIPNRNKRIYPLATLEREVNRYVENYVNKNRAFGELGHPEGPTVNLDRASHMFTELARDGSNFVGKARITNEGNGKIVKGLIDIGANLGVSSRGMGSLKNVGNDINEVQDDYKLATAGDIVADPSAPDAFVDGIMEGVEWVECNGAWFPEYQDRARTALRKATKSELEEQILNQWQTFLHKAKLS